MPSTIDTYDIENAVRSAIDNTFSFSYGFEDGIKSAVRNEISSSLSSIEYEISSLELNNIESAVNN